MTTQPSGHFWAAPPGTSAPVADWPAGWTSLGTTTDVQTWDPADGPAPTVRGISTSDSGSITFEVQQVSPEVLRILLGWVPAPSRRAVRLARRARRRHLRRWARTHHHAHRRTR